MVGKRVAKERLPQSRLGRRTGRHVRGTPGSKNEPGEGGRQADTHGVEMESGRGA